MVHRAVALGRFPDRKVILVGDLNLDFNSIGKMGMWSGPGGKAVASGLLTDGKMGCGKMGRWRITTADHTIRTY